MSDKPVSTSADSAYRTFLHLLVNTAVAGLTTSYLWFGLTFWTYLETRSILATGVIGGAYMLLVSVSSIVFGSLVDRLRKVVAMRVSSVMTLGFFGLATGLWLAVPGDQMTDLSRPWFWTFALLILVGSVVEHMRNIALSTSVTILIQDDRRDRANGLVGTAQGITFLTTSVLSGLSIGMLGMGWTLAMALGLVSLGLIHLFLIRMPQEPVPAAAGSDDFGRIDLAGSIVVIRATTGLLALIVFSTFNNFVGGVYMALMDPYGLEMFRVEVWGVVLGVSSLGFLVGGAVVAKVGLGRSPVRTLLLCVAAMGALGALFTIRELWWLYAAGIFAYMTLIPAVEAAEQTVIQRVIPLERQGRVFGFAMAVETAAAPITAFLIAPIADRWIIPFASSEEGRRILDPLVGTGTPVSRGIAVVFLVAGLLMVVVALLALRSPAYRSLVRAYADAAPADVTPVAPVLRPGEAVTATSAAAAVSQLHAEGPAPAGHEDEPTGSDLP
ncbi:MFS transporter [Nostocoides sp. F2B08]|uniref:MFS transporter n=1 Tax=Nostocoides sp. F2B08 TaxID=2653936 RepID=UPI00126375DD|nr:MFS transporter [Tetrasphaera sp. F2B08]KAB7746063.1 MFS transporter [Tetrasphaera sp. F2B08]